MPDPHILFVQDPVCRSIARFAEQFGVEAMALAGCLDVSFQEVVPVETKATYWCV